MIKFIEKQIYLEVCNYDEIYFEVTECSKCNFYEDHNIEKNHHSCRIMHNNLLLSKNDIKPCLKYISAESKLISSLHYNTNINIISIPIITVSPNKENNECLDKGCFGVDETNECLDKGCFGSDETTGYFTQCKYFQRQTVFYTNYCKLFKEDLQQTTHQTKEGFYTHSYFHRCKECLEAEHLLDKVFKTEKL